MPPKADFTPWNEKEPLLIPHLSSATGDTIHVAAALVLYERLDVIVVHHGEVGSCDGLLNFYRHITQSNERVKVVYTINEKTAYVTNTALTNPDRDIKATLGKLFNNGAQPFLRPNVAPPALPEPIANVSEFCGLYLAPHTYTLVGNLGQATAAVAYKFSHGADGLTDIYTLLANRLSLPTLNAREIIEEADRRPTFAGKPLPRYVDGGRRPVALLWARYTGTNSLTEYNPEGDSSVQGQAQLLKLLKPHFNVITIGHGPRGGDPVKSEFDVGEFYLKEPITTDRASQASFFLALMETYPGGLFQIGQKTGGMDCAALLGVPTLYLEHKKSHSFQRMQKWVGKVPFYRNSIIERPPSRVGASLRMTFDEIPDFTKLYKFGKAEEESQARASAKTRLACMIYKYPAEMGESRMVLKTVVDWVSTRPATELDEVPCNPKNDGELAQKIRTVNLSATGAGPVGYTDADLAGIAAKLEQLKTDYMAETAVIRTAGGIYKTRGIKQ